MKEADQAAVVCLAMITRHGEIGVLFPRVELGEMPSPDHFPGLYFFSISLGAENQKEKKGSKNSK